MTPCIEWPGAKDKCGYGRVLRNGKNRLAHRMVMADLHGDEAIVGKVVMHLCDNPPCVNPEHLRIGTQKDNMSDARDKGRWRGPKGTYTDRLGRTRTWH